MTSKLKVAKSGDREINAERWFDAPRERVWQAFTDPELIPQWWGPRETNTVGRHARVQARRGVAVRSSGWRTGPETGFRGEFREIEEPDRIVWTFEWEGMPGHVSVDAVTFTEHDGGTLVRTVSTFDSQQDRDGMLESGMEKRHG